MREGSILIVEQTWELKHELRHAFEERGYLTWTCPGADLAASICEAIHPALVLIDLDLAGSDPGPLLETWKRLAPSARLIVEILEGDDSRLRIALEHGADGFVLKPLSPGPVVRLLSKPPAAA